jgi:hypothetical protein
MADMQNFHYAISLAQTLYDVDISDVEMAEEIGLVAYGLIGNHHTRLYKTVLDIGPGGRAELPCNLLCIESVTFPCGEDWEYTSNLHEYGDTESRNIENFIEAGKRFTDPTYQGGRFVKYRQEGRFLVVGPEVGKVSVLYHGELLDEDGLPYLNDKEALAIAEYIAHITKYKEAIKTNNVNILRMAQELKQQWLFHCDAARVPEHLSQNDMDRILDAQASWNRKKYHLSYKPTL